MISYETYKLMHLGFIMMFFSSMGLVAGTNELVQKKSTKIIIGLMSFLIFVAGMGLIARLGFKHGEPFPLWIILKMAAWFIINILFVFLFKFKKFTHKFFIAFWILLIGWGAVWVALNKPL